MRNRLFRGRKNGHWLIGVGVYKTREINYCFREEEPEDNTRTYLILEQRGDWGLPNIYAQSQVENGSTGEYLEILDDTGKHVFEGDYVRWEAKGVEGEIVRLSAGIPGVRDRNHRFTPLEMRASLHILGNRWENPEFAIKEFEED